ncbi:unconventional myosin IC isoform X1 [Amyelois transitella]|uniref:unconventional myosin IC isoform X1 n=2 Tax=Amyelois transitella TaxID=680683 RepID=UPI00299033C6|nr:unconventional myosin IC isoform X1 [Amyelois transitella]XP_060803260.1 unconventional myosin IC isoform X1 [Amyelois transitella]XP_060803261.1 unconventional myosin IC isoform X1 [Amyelois transitella]
MTDQITVNVVENSVDNAPAPIQVVENSGGSLAPPRELHRPYSVQGDMEHALQHRERVGVQDFVLLEDYRSEAAFIDNLKKRFHENIIYTYIGNVLISVNPYKNLPIYTEEKTKLYYKKAFFEAPPHVFAIADNAYRSLVYEHREQCILISGESGSGKTEASKKVLEYIAARTNHLHNVETVKDKLLQSNPLLEAFGNAKTHKNDNSSRFGKYMDIQFNYEGAPEGGHILNYLLEKSRVVSQMSGERNFHIFYQLLAGADPELLNQLRLQNKPENYKYTTDTNPQISQLKYDAEQFRIVQGAMKIIEIGAEEQRAIFEIVASVLHLGNVKFNTSEKGHAEILHHDAHSSSVAELLKVNATRLREVLTSRTIDARGDVVSTPLDLEQSQYARDALAKAMYDKHFSWLVSRLNASLAPKDQDARASVIGILDIYGFEIFPKNSFEQFCINFCNEKLQQLFIQLTLRQEQEEYLREGIEWEPVEYFNNIIICDLIEARHKGIIAILDDECLRPGDATDASFLERLSQQLDGHPHYKSHRKADSKTQKLMGRDEFCLKHYAGEVTYNVNTFLEKNNDLLFRDIQSLMAGSGNNIVASCFKDLNLRSKKRPETAITQFKNSLNDLIKILSSKEPSYIRCIKPNDFKAPMQFDEKLVSHQVKYLGLMENLRVRRAGFAYRRTYEAFLERYKCLSSDTWPNYRGAPRDGVQVLVNALKYEREDYRMGNTKIFIRFPKTLFETEDAFQTKKNDIATIIQSRWRGYWQRKQYLKMRAAAIIVQKWVRRFLAQKLKERRRWAAGVIRSFIKGFITRNGPETPENRRFLGIAKVHWLKRLSKQLPTKILDLSWPICPATCQEASKELQRLHRAHLSRKYRLALSPENKKQFELKVLAESIFKGKKNSYPSSIRERFVSDRLTPEHQTLRNTFMASPSWPAGEQLIYSCEAVKYDRRGYKPRERALIASDKALYVLDASSRKTYKLKHRLPLEKLKVVVTNESDSLILVKIPQELKKDKGDLIISVSYLVEALTIVTDYTKKPQLIDIVDTRTIAHNMVNGKQAGSIEVTNGPQPTIHRAKSGNLLVVATP